jgi:choline-sulfatase
MNTCRNTLTVAWALAVLPGMATHVFAKPNVVLIVCDDLNDFVTGMDGHPQARTPNIEKLAASGVSFRRAYCNVPVCAPSRSSFMTGIYAHTSRNMHFKNWRENPVLANCMTLSESFRAGGYHTVGSGKVMHHVHPDLWDEYKYKPDYGPFVYDGQQRVAHPSVPEPFRSIGPRRRFLCAAVRRAVRPEHPGQQGLDLRHVG